MSLEQTIDNLQIRNANMVTFVGTSNTMVDTTTGRIQTKGFQHNSNVITDISGPHGRGVATLKKYPEIDFESGKFDITEIVAGSDQYWDGPSTVFQGGYSLKTTQHSTDSGGKFGWMAFDGNSETFWKNAEDYDAASGNYDYGYTGIQQRLTDTNSTNHDGDHVIMGSPNALKMAKVTVTCKHLDRRVVNYSVLGSNSSGTTGWTLLDSGTFTAQDVNTATISSPTSYFKYHAFVVGSVTANTNGTRFHINSIDFYGYEEDPPAGDHSVDTTFKSRFNNPQLTGVQVLVDGATGVGTNQISGGPDPSGNQSTYVTDGKYWTLNGTLTSNLAVEANTFLEGDQPHAVSVWFNSSNLEANTANTCVFSIASEEKLDSVNLDLQSNTWHNLTYAYQGEGGSRVTYLDGRKVAEDQAEDTFGDYPPFAMTGYSQGGYVVSTSSEHSSGSYQVWEAFNNKTSTDTDNYVSGNYYATSGGDGTRSTITWSGSTNHNGEFIKLELPHKLIVNYVKFEGRQGSGVERQLPRAFTIIGSNDDVNWETIHQETRTANPSTGETHAMTGVSKHKGFKYIALVPKNSGTTNTNTHISIGNISYYGHRENDLVRLPDPTNVLKYPHIAMTGPAQRGYVASSNNEYTPDGRLAWKAYDGIDTDGSTNVDAWMTVDPSWTTATPGEPIGTGDLAPDTFTVGGVNYTGHWNKLELPHKIRVSQIYMSSRMSTRLPYKGVFLGSDDDSSWEVIYSFNNTLTWSTVSGVGQATTITGITNTNSYKYVMLVVQQINGSDDRLWLNQIKYYGTGVDSIPIQIGGGNIDKVANFRVYDRFIEEDQALEIWNAQKEEFRRAKPQMVLQQGKLGIGTDAPQGSLSVADEPHNLEEFPPRAMTGYETYMEGHGVFKASASDEYTTTGNGSAFSAFDKNEEEWAGDGTFFTSGILSGNGLTTITPGIGPGSWLQLELPYKILLQKWAIQQRTPQSTRHLKNAILAGSNDGYTWDTIQTITDEVSQTTLHYRYYDVSGTSKYYKIFRLVITEVQNNDRADINEIKYFGTREQGQSILHDGQLTLTKNLDVPRIGPALDADDTPRRDRLVVEYNTSTNPTFDGAVRDTSGRGNDGILLDGAYYNATEKSLDLSAYDGNLPSGSQTAHIKSGILPGFTGNQAHTVSFWYKGGSDIDGYWVVIAPQTGEGTNKVSSILYEPANNRFNLVGWSNDFFVNYTAASYRWYHIVVTYNGTTVTTTNKKMYIDGVLQTNTASNTEGAAMAFPDNMIVCLAEKSAGSGETNPEISNFKLYDTALTAEEVKTLYDMGRNGSVANPQPLHISGPVNVMGDIRYITSRPLALPTMWDHMANGNCAKGVYPIVGRNGGTTIYHVYCEPDWAGGGWMCMAQFAKDGYQVKAHPTNGDLNIFTKSLGDSKNIRWNNTFAVPLNILSLDGNGYDLDVMIVVLGGGYAGRYEGGMRVGSIWRGHQLSVAFNPGTSSYPGASGLASSSDGYSFTTRTPVTNQNYDMINSGGWYYSCAANANYQGSYNDQGLSDGGYILHQGSLNKVGSIYGAYHSDTGVAYNSQGNTDFACVRIFVRPSI